MKRLLAKKQKHLLTTLPIPQVRRLVTFSQTGSYDEKDSFCASKGNKSLSDEGAREQDDMQKRIDTEGNYFKGGNF